MNPALIFFSGIFDNLYQYWESSRNQKRIGSILVVVYLITLFTVFINNKFGLFTKIGINISGNLFVAIEMAFVFLLIVEVISLVFVLSKSVTRSLIKQFEILSLILLRKAFSEFGNFAGEIQWENISSPVYHVFTDAFGALVIFLIVILIVRFKRREQITRSDEEQLSFINLKKLIALILLLVFIGLAIFEVSRSLIWGIPSNFFRHFYTVLIFSDILIVLTSLRYNYSYVILFRNSGFALATVVIRLALSSPPYVNVLLGITAGLFTLGIVVTYSKLVVKT